MEAVEEVEEVEEPQLQFPHQPRPQHLLQLLQLPQRPQGKHNNLMSASLWQTSFKQPPLAVRLWSSRRPYPFPSFLQ